ncbi:protein-disulfide reductase DsbD family protein [Rhodanobacter terrae]|uniref:Protein-disulfide reductase DsbD family protein n=1 Tax=Rhodanobacter terrae TaxID=418647 RepID=A0ABW0SWJ5_9GAMM
MARKPLHVFWIALVIWLATVLPATAEAQSPVDVSLVSIQRSVQPGKPITVALRVQHRPHWHTFWKNPGTGLPTELQWDLPSGWVVGSIQWPTPVLVLDAQGNISGHGYVGLLYLPMTMTPPVDARPGSQVVLKATAHWLMCDTVCVPGEQDVSLTLPVSADPPVLDEAVRAAIAKMPMPRAATDWKLAASEDSHAVTLHVVAPGEVSNLHFFPEDQFIAYKQPQTVASRGDRALLKMALDADEPMPAGARLRGVLAYTDVQGGYNGVDVNLPFVSDTAAAAATAVQVSAVGPTVTDSTRAGNINNTGTAGGLSVGALLFALLGGLILNLMPCVFPVLGIKVMGFIDQAGKDRRTVAAHAWGFTAGVMLSFWALAGALALLRAGGQQLGWGFQLQSAPFVFGLAVVMLMFALNLSGVFEIGVRATSIGSRLQARRGIAGSFFAGVLATVVATPCSAPFLAPALGAALALPVAQSFLVFTFIALGLSLPYLLLSVFPGLIQWLPRPGAWMETFKQAMAFPLFATVGYLVWVLAGQASEYGLLNALFALAVVAFALWVYGRFSRPGTGVGCRRFALIGGLLLFVLALGLGWPRRAPAAQLKWETWSPERVTQLRQQGRGIYVDFTARWCATCQVNKKVVFGSPAVQAYFREQHIAMLEADWTNSDPRITAALAKWGRSAVPFNLVYPPGGDSSAPLVMPSLLTPKIVLNAFRKPAGVRP